MTRSYKTKLHVANDTQNDFLILCMAVKRKLYNLYLNVQFGLLETRKRLYPDYDAFKELPKETQNQFYISAAEFEKVFNHVIRVSGSYPAWWDQAPQKTRKQAFRDAERAFRNYFKGLAKEPRFKGYHARGVAYFSGSIHIQRDRIKLPLVGWLRLSEFGYLPTDDRFQKTGYHITGCWVSRWANDYWVAVTTDEPAPIRPVSHTGTKLGLGIDLGVKDMAVLNTGEKFINIAKTHYYFHVEKMKKRWQARLAHRKIAAEESFAKNHPHQKAGHLTSRGIEEARYYLARWLAKLAKINKETVRQAIARVVKLKPPHITVEKLNIKGMKANPKMAPSLQKLGLSYFKTWLTWQCQKHGIELREVSTWYPSTKLCHQCGTYNRAQFHGTLADLAVRQFNCPHCGLSIDRDVNAAINLQQATEYTVLTVTE
ncbi:RNA-guided endonuclease InsQ/TnpB family protein [Schleiferilactobacillus perolens]|jgi:putative transposase|uniref:RNA-guided endonuclease InsQ/TnpB family protein n=1 Tax=Schleiferilactobacillus perolens TaxID=100468 RepID=UPI002357A5E1|nr:transposase [Schleiferilactobacillus perolens]MCI2171067.1 transposase [Schleiferilactobacillus perolens]